MYKLKEEPVENVAEPKVEETKKEIKEEDHKEDSKKDVLNPVYLCDTKVYSNLIYEHVKDVDLNQKCLGKLDTYITGHILGFLDYKTIMSNIRYLSKSFIKFTTDMLHYIPDLKKDAFIRVKAPKMYKGVDKMPPLRHPYYKNWESLNVIYIVTEKNDTSVKSKYDTMLLIDLFYQDELFPNCKELTITPIHSYW